MFTELYLIYESSASLQAICSASANFPSPITPSVMYFPVRFTASSVNSTYSMFLTICVRLSNPSIHQPLSSDIWIAALAEVNAV